MDIEYFESFLGRKPKRLITTTEHFTVEDMEWIRKVGYSKVIQFMIKAEKNEEIRHSVDFVCEVCKKKGTIEGLNREGLKRQISYPKTTCNECEQAIARQEAEERERRRQEEEDKIRLLCLLLDPDGSWPDDVDLETKQRVLEEVCDSVEVSSFLKDMTYSEFLMTPYWKACAAIARKRAGNRCQLCNSKGCLHVHHRTYDYHGAEHTKEGQANLVVLCKDCHETFHRKEKEVAS